jgi:carboxypeptidase Taq
MESKLKALKSILLEINDLNAAAAVLQWDQATYMPPGGIAARARQLATLRRLAHDKFIDRTIGKLLNDLRPYEETLPYDSDDASIIRVARRDYEKAVKIPPSFMEKLSDHLATSYHIWTKARPANDFAALQSYLEKTLEMSRQLANFFPGFEHIADPLIDLSDYGMKVSTLRKLFADLRSQLVPMLHAISSHPATDDSCLRQNFPEPHQIAFGLEVIRCFGYDFERGRQDKTHHPFMTKFSLGDVRITTRIKENDLKEALFSTIHEAGHALYEQGICKEFEGTPLARGTSSGVHESQARLWENLIGRSRGFWQFFYPKLQVVFPDQLGSVPLETFYRAINKVERSLIRTDADEVTYNLHVIIRFDLELALLEGRLAVRDLPEAWCKRYEVDLGAFPPDDRDGVMQDVHWYGGIVGGAFQEYALGNIMSAQFFEAALHAHPEITTEMERGVFDLLHGWLKNTIYQHGCKYTPSELVERVTGNPLSIGPYIRYLKTKYGDLYKFSS